MSYALGLKRAEIYRGNGKIPAWLCVCVYLCVCVSLDFDMKVLCRCSRPSTDDFGTAQQCPFVSEHKNTNLSIFMSLNIADLRGSRLQLQDLDYVKDIERWREKKSSQLPLADSHFTSSKNTWSGRLTVKRWAIFKLWPQNSKSKAVL